MTSRRVVVETLAPTTETISLELPDGRAKLLVVLESVLEVLTEQFDALRATVIVFWIRITEPPALADRRIQ
ncbi:hypothetical protein [Natronorubrum sp. FCH18a]|uniref:hypothetical protein n=1 Tax=Natronorubrum sp. FCH18a TaxID=3447018 RepID=UPI003F50EECC